MNIALWFKEVFARKNSKFSILFIAAFLAQASFIPLSILLFSGKKPLPYFLSPLFSYLCFFLFAIFIYIYFNRTSSTPTKFDLTGIGNGILTTVANFLLILLIMLVYALISQQWIKAIPLLMNKDMVSISIVSGYILSIVLLQILVFSGIVLFSACLEFSLSIGMQGKAYRLILRLFLRRFISVLLYSILLGFLLLLVNFSQNLVADLIGSFISPGFFKNFMLYLAAAVTNAYFIFVSLNLSKKLLSKDVTLAEKIKTSFSKRIPIFPAVVLLLTFGVLAIVYQPNANSADLIIDEINHDLQKGDMLGTLGLAQQSIYEYNSGYSKLLSLRGYLEGLKAFKDNDKALKEQSYTDLDQAAKISPKNPYSAFFKGSLLAKIDKNLDGAADSFSLALARNNAVLESSFGLLNIYESKNQAQNRAEVLEVLLGNEMYFDRFAGLQNFSLKKLDKYLDKLTELENEVEPKFVYAAVEKTKLGDQRGALADLIALAKKYPKDSLINYSIAKTAEQFKNEQGNYPMVKEFAAKFESNYDAKGNTEDEIGKKLFKAQMYLAANELLLAQQILKELYDKFPQNLDVQAQYAYILNKNKEYDEAIKVSDKLISAQPDHYASYSLKAIALLNKKDYANSLNSIQKFLDLTTKDESSTPVLDETLYAYSLTFSKFTSDKAALEEVAKFKNNSLLYNYLYAIKGWKDKDSESSKQYMENVLRDNPGLGYANYVMGINYYEEAVRKDTKDFAKAEKYYLKSLEILPDHAEGYFAMGHLYKKAGKNLQALRAFRKVVDLMPYEDHRLDPYGLTVHAIGEINSLSQYDVKEEK